MQKQTHVPLIYTFQYDSQHLHVIYSHKDWFYLEIISSKARLQLSIAYTFFLHNSLNEYVVHNVL